MNYHNLKTLSTIISLLKIYPGLQFKVSSMIGQSTLDVYKEVEVDTGTEEIFHHQYNKPEKVKISFILRDGFSLAFIKRETNHGIRYELNNKLHRDNGPALINLVYNKEEYYKHGVIHRDNGPALIKYDIQDNQILEVEKYFINGEYHREGDKPSHIIYEDNIIVKERFFKNGKIHRENPSDGAEIEYWMDDDIRVKDYETFYKDGKLHREDGPAKIYHETTKDKEKYRQESYYVDGKLHREDGPARISYSLQEDGSYKECGKLYYFKGNQCNEDGSVFINNKKSKKKNKENKN